MNKKYIFAVLSVSTLLLTTPTFAFAQTATESPKMKREMKMNPNKSNKLLNRPGSLRPLKSINKTIDQLSRLSTKLETRISSASAAGNDVTTLTALLTDMKSKIADAKSQATNAATLTITITPPDTNASRSGVRKNFKNTRSWVAAIRNDLRLAMQDAIKIIRGLKAFKTNTTGTPTATDSEPTITPTETLTPTPTV